MCGRTGMSWRRRSTPGSRTGSRGGDDRVCLRRGEGLRSFQGGRETWKTASWQPAGSRIRLPLKESDIPVAVNPKSADGSSNNPQCGFWDSQFSAAQVKSVEQPWLIAEINDLPPSAWRTINLDVPNRKYRTPKVYEQKVCLRKCTYRQFFIKDLGHDLPTILLTNDRKSTVPQLILRYAKRMLIENALADAVRFFHIDALSSSVGFKVDFDMALLVLASGLYRIMARR